jgi:predicted HTH domain antitoxin
MVYCEAMAEEHMTEEEVLASFKGGKISAGKAAQLLGMTKVEFLDLLAARGIAYIDYEPAEIADELEAAKQLGDEASEVLGD